MGKTAFLAVGAAAAMVFAAPATASALSVGIGEEFTVTATAPSELVEVAAAKPSVYDLCVSRVRTSGNIACEKDPDEWDDNESGIVYDGYSCRINMKSYKFGKSDVEVTWKLSKKRSWGEVASMTATADEPVSVLSAEVPYEMCDDLFDGVKLTKSKMFKQHDEYSYDEEDVWLASATRGYRFAKGSGYKVVGGGKYVKFSKGANDAEVRMAKGDTRITVTLGVVHSQKALRKKLLSYFPKKRWDVHGEFSDGHYTVDATYRRKGRTYLGIATGWYSNGEFHGLVPSKG